jgi:hypothetical protein
MEFVAPHWRSMVFGRASPFSPHNPPPPPGATRSGMLLAETPLDKWSDPGRDYVRVLLDSTGRPQIRPYAQGRSNLTNTHAQPQPIRWTK